MRCAILMGHFLCAMLSLIVCCICLVYCFIVIFLFLAVDSSLRIQRRHCLDGIRRNKGGVYCCDLLLLRGL